MSKLKIFFMLLWVFGFFFANLNAIAKPKEDPLEAVLSGNQRFVSEHPSKIGNGLTDVKRLAKGQAPKTVIVSCSDSRVPPEIVLDQKLGELFVVRSAGQTLSPEALGSIEFAINQLGASLILVLGHTSCGAINAALSTPSEKSTGSKNLDSVVAAVRGRFSSVSVNAKHSHDLSEEGKINAANAAKEIVARSELIAQAVKVGKVKVSAGVYDLATGKIEIL